MRILLLLPIFLSSLAMAENINLLRIEKIDQGLPRNGQVNVVVTYWKSCHEEFLGLLLKPVLQAAQPTIEVRAIARELGVPCKSLDIPLTEVFWVKVGTQIIPVQP